MKYEPANLVKIGGRWYVIDGGLLRATHDSKR